MAQRRPNPRLAKIHRSYTVEEAARLFGVHRNTVREWIRRGLQTVDRQRPTLILGRELAAYLKARRDSNRRPCQAGELYCMRCRVPRIPFGLMADYLPVTATSGNLIGLCPACDLLMYRRVSKAKLDAVKGPLEVRPAQAGPHIVETPQPSVNSDISTNAHTYDELQPLQRAR